VAGLGAAGLGGRNERMLSRRTFVKAAVATPLLGSALAVVPGVAAQSGAIRVGSKDFPEEIIIGEMYALLLEGAGFKVERKLNLGGTAVAHQALLSGDLDVYPEYTGTGLLVILQKQLSANAVDAVYEYVKEQYKTRFNLVWLDQTPMNDSQALAVTRQFSEEHGVTTISQLAALASSVEITISAPVDFEEREDGLKGLRQVYGDFPATVNGVAPGLKYQALLDGDANVVLAFSTDAEIKINDLVVLDDDKGLWPPYHVAPVVRQEALDANAGMADALNALAPKLTTEQMTSLNARVVGDEKAEPATVAKDFLVQQGLIGG
jgi:osmoprotectant transport system substrate-binding protein